MLTEGEKDGMRAILSSLSPEDLESLVATATKNQIALPNTKDKDFYQECFNAILAFTETAKDFLTRRVCSKAVLSNYAYKEGLPLTSKLSKDDLVRRILEHWSGSTGFSSGGQGHQSMDQFQLENHSQQMSACSPPFNIPVVHINSTLNITCQVNAPQVDLESEFGVQFARWFYGTLNHPDPASQGFGPSSFLSEANLKLIHLSMGALTSNEYTATGQDEVASQIINVFKNYSFQPNLSENGIIVKSESHGLKIILVKGIVNKFSCLCGVFEQSFGLAQDPYVMNNWKIKFTELHLKEN